MLIVFQLSPRLFKMPATGIVPNSNTTNPFEFLPQASGCISINTDQHACWIQVKRRGDLWFVTLQAPRNRMVLLRTFITYNTHEYVLCFLLKKFISPVHGNWVEWCVFIVVRNTEYTDSYWHTVWHVCWWTILLQSWMIDCYWLGM